MRETAKSRTLVSKGNSIFDFSTRNKRGTVKFDDSKKKKRPSTASVGSSGSADIEHNTDLKEIAAQEVTIAEQNHMVTKWWFEIDESKFGVATLNQAAEKLI